MTSSDQNYNFYVFSFDHKGEIETQWQTILRCAECVAQHHQIIEQNESCVLRIDDTSNMWNDILRVRLIRCTTLEEREEHLKMCSIMIETFKYMSLLSYIPTFAWRCARTPEATEQNFPQCFRLENKERRYLTRIVDWIEYPWLDPQWINRHK